MRAEVCTIDGACGVTNVSDFGKRYSELVSNKTNFLKGGTGYIFSAFVVGEEKSDEIYRLLKSKYDLVFQSETRLNINSGNLFYFCIFDGLHCSDELVGFDGKEHPERNP